MFAKIPCILRPLAILVLPMLLFACAPKLQPLGPVVTAPSFGNDRLVMDDGVGLPLRHWPAEGKTKAVVLAIHGFNDYSHAFEEPAEDWAKEGIATYAFDQRGFGHTEFHNPLGRNLNLFAGCGIAPDARFAIYQYEFAQSRQREGVLGILVGQVRNRFEDLRGLLFSNARAFSDGRCDLRFG